MKNLSDRERYIFWKLAHDFIVDMDFRLVHSDEQEQELWVETVRHKEIDVIRIFAGNMDWTNWLKQDIIRTADRAENIRKQLFKRDFHVLNLYVTEHEPVDDYETVLAQPYDTGSGHTKIHTLLLAKETLAQSITELNRTFDKTFEVQPEEPYEDLPVEELRQSALQKVKKEEKEAREIFEFGNPFFTYIFIAAQLIMYYVLESNGGSTNVETLIHYGAKYNPLIIAGEWWRFFTPIFLHIGLLHLLMNTFALFYLGTAVERIYGRFRFLWIYLFSGFAGSLASFLFTSNVSAGASGAIFGCFGALLYMGVVNPRLFFRTIGMNVIVVIIINLVFGFTFAGIDNAGHLGGLAGGFLATGIVHFPKKRKWVLQLLFIVVSLLTVYFALQWGFDPDRTDTVNVLAQKQIEDGDIEAAHDTLSNLIAKGKGDAVTYFQAAYTEIHLQRLAEAKEHLHRAIEMKPDFHEAHFNLALVYDELGESEKAREYAVKAEKLSSEKKYREFLKEIE
ncbi:rhomboid family intramembrane serine protease [Siminovitchia sediminis]|uniref:Rhomboid family intramembrane serine protease n=1 Tax=Siminovitchia sediminis TaxID=1274353 RepID=A0ABW4KB23_9BACI